MEGNNKMVIRKTLYTCVLIFQLLSCNSKFSWKDFHSESIVDNKESKTIYGGSLYIHWEAKGNGQFAVQNALSFARKMHWKFIDSISMKQAQLSSWYYNSKPIFPLSFNGFSATSDINNSTYQFFPRRIDSDLIVLIFETDKVIIEQGTNEEVKENGFLVFNKLYDKMSLYFLWGE